MGTESHGTLYKSAELPIVRNSSVFKNFILTKMRNFLNNLFKINLIKIYIRIYNENDEQKRE